MTPLFQILADGEDATGALQDRLISMSITDEDGRSADTLVLSIDDRDQLVARPETGVKLDVSLGLDETGLVPMGRYVVDRIRGKGMPRTMSIQCTAADMASSLRTPKSRAWSDATLADIVADIASEAGLTAVVSASLRGTSYPLVVQSAESDMGLLLRLARPLDATAKPAGGNLVVAKRDEGTNAAGDAIAPVELTATELSTWTWDIDERQKYESVEAEWGDINGGTTKTVRAGSGKPVRKLRHVFANQAEAQRAADAELAMANRQRIKVSGNCAGFRPALFAGGTVSLSGLRDDIDGTYLIARVQHDLEGSLTTTFDARKAKE